MRLSDEIRRVERDIYTGKCDRRTGIVVLNELMHYYRFLGAEEQLVDLPDDFGRIADREGNIGDRTGYVGEFTVRHNSSAYSWKRSYLDQNLGEHLRDNKPTSGAGYDVGRRSSSNWFFVPLEGYTNKKPQCFVC